MSRSGISRIAVVVFVVAAVVVAGSVGVAQPAASAVVCTRSVHIDPAPQVKEGSPLVFTATLVTPPTCPLVGTVNYRTKVPVIGGVFDATPGNSPVTPKVDYITKSGTLEWMPGDPAAKEISVQTLADSRAEVSEEVEVCLERPSDIDIPNPCARGELFSPMCMQAGTTVAFVIGLSVPARDTVDVFYDTVPGTAREGEDYVGVHNGRVQIPRGQLDTIAPVRILPNQPGEGFEYFFVDFRSTHDGYTEMSRVKVDIMTPR